MIGLYIVIFFLVFNNFTANIVYYWSMEQGNVYDPVVGYSEQFQEFLVVECPKEYPTEKYDERSDCPGRTEVNIRDIILF